MYPERIRTPYRPSALFRLGGAACAARGRFLLLLFGLLSLLAALLGRGSWLLLLDAHDSLRRLARLLVDLGGGHGRLGVDLIDLLDGCELLELVLLAWVDLDDAVLDLFATANFGGGVKMYFIRNSQLMKQLLLNR